MRMKAVRLGFVGFSIGLQVGICHAQVLTNSYADVVCLAKIESVDPGVALQAICKDGSKGSRAIPGVVLHLHVEGQIIGKVPTDIVVLADGNNLRFHGYAWGVSNAKEATASSKSPKILMGRQVHYRNLEGMRALFQLQVRQPQGTFFVSESDRIRDSWPMPQPVWSVQSPGPSYALSCFSDEEVDAIYPTENTSFDSNLPDGLKLLDFYANEALRSNPPNPVSIHALHVWNPVQYRSQLANRKTFLDAVPDADRQAWFSRRFDDNRLPPAARDDFDLLALRADWGDQGAYKRFRAIAMKTGKTSRVVWLPHMKDPDLWLHLAKHTDSPEEARVLFMLLQNAPETKRKTLSLARQMLGLHPISDQGILECVYKLTGNASLAADSQGMRKNLEAQRLAARRVISKELAQSKS